MPAISRRALLRTAASSLTLAVVGTSALTAQSPSLKFEIYKDSKGGFRWRLKAANGRVIGTSGEAYKAKADCRKGIETIKQGAATAAVAEVP